MYEKVNLIVCKNNESIFPIFLLLPEISGDQIYEKVSLIVCKNNELIFCVKKTNQFFLFS